MTSPGMMWHGAMHALATALRVPDKAGRPLPPQPPLAPPQWESRHIRMQATWAPGSQPAFSVDLSVLIDGRRSVTAVWPQAAAAEAAAALDRVTGNGAAAAAGARAGAAA